MKIMPCIAAVAAAIVVGVAAVVFAYPAAAAAACPGCYGFEDAGGGLYLQETATPDERSNDVRAVSQARLRLSSFYGPLRGHPRILICQSDQCYGPLGGGSRGLAMLDRAIVLSPRGANTEIMTHELSHIEVKSRIGPLNTLEKAVPQWFDEGLAAYVSDDRRYIKPAGEGDRCILEPDENMPTTRNAWVESAATRDLYARAACKVSRWIDQHGGPMSVDRLLDAVAAGTPFETAWR